MTIDWLDFTPWSALAGGALIGLAAALFILANGRIAGISGLLGSLLQRGSEGWGEKALGDALSRRSTCRPRSPTLGVALLHHSGSCRSCS